MRSPRHHVAALVVLAVITLVMTYPLVLQLGSSARDPGDPLLNAWILAWDVEQLATGDLSGFFEANIFYPNQRTLAYSEHLFTQSLVAVIPLLIWDNPVLALNLVTLFSMLTSAFAMYLLAHHLTDNTVAGLSAGIVYGFSPFMIDHLVHMQLLTAGGIPLVFLFLARLFSRERWYDLAWLGLFMVLQMLANGYYAVYLAFFVSVTIAYHVLAAGKLRDPRFLGMLVVLVLGVALATAPFMYQYIALQREMGFQRMTPSHVEITSFLSTPWFNRLYGGWFPRQPEGRLFPGFVAVALAVAGVAGAVRGRHRGLTEPTRFATWKIPLAPVFNTAVVLLFAVMASVLFFGGLNLPTWAFAGPLITIGFLLALRAALDPPFRRRWFPPLRTPRSWLFFFLAILVFSVLASFGTSINGPYRLLYDHVPGFNGIRSTGRIHIMTLNSLAVLAAFGVAGAQASSQRRWLRLTAAAGIPLLMLMEYFSAPIPTTRIPSKDELPPVYRWLAEDPEGGPILELPLAFDGPRKNLKEIARVYSSTIHWRPMINGYSGYLPPLYIEMRRRWRELGPGQVLADAKSLGVQEVLVHTELFQGSGLQKTRAALSEMNPVAARIADLDGVEVWRIATAGGAPAIPGREEFRALPSSGWQITADVNPKMAAFAIDGDPATRWHGRAQRPGQTFTIDLGSRHRVRAIELWHGKNRNSFPRGLMVELSTGTGRWRVVANRRFDRLPIEAFLRPLQLPLIVEFEPADAHYLRLTTTAGQDPHRWSINEIRIW
ncbi:MAG: discoidin domain-containing protein [Acidobacteriota bacterium]|nr:discoidin domain-containing protein [Acidobacteriota bacterium]